MQGASDPLGDAFGALDPATPDETPITLTAGEIREAVRKAYESGTGQCELASSEARLQSLYFRQLMDSLPDFVYFKDLESRFRVINRAHAGNLGIDRPEDAVGKTDLDFFSEEDGRQKIADEQQIMRTGRGFPPKVEHNHHTGGVERWALSTKHPLFDENGEICGIFGLSRDVTEEYRAKQELAEQHRLLETLINVLPCRLFVRDREHRFRLINEEYRRNLNLLSTEQIIGRRFEEFVKNERQERIVDEDEEIMKRGKSILRRVEFDTSPVEEGRWLSVSKVPLRAADGGIEGVVGVSFDITAQKEAEAKAKAFGKALQHKNMQMESELALARKLQTTLATFRFPEEIEMGDHGTLQASYLYQPSEHLAGDFFHIFRIDEHRVGAFICDVMGHGVRSALVTAVVRGLLEEKRAACVEPSKVFAEINTVLHSLAEDPDFPRFVTASFALFDLASQTVEVVCAGHPPLLGLSRHDGRLEAHPLTQARDPALGLVANYTYQSRRSPLGDDRLFLLYTDGILEERDGEDHEFGREGLEGCLEDTESLSAPQVIQLIRNRLERHCGRREFADDVCAVAISLR
jgi:sigma-B regulation protein RsbU (phosphoserine phosphatase)